MYAMACHQRDYLWKLFAVENKQSVPAEDRNILPRGYGWSPMSFAIVHIAFRDNLESFNETKWPPVFAFQTPEEIKLYNKLVNVLCRDEVWLFWLWRVISLEFAATFLQCQDPERDCQSIECSWMGDIYFDFSKPPKEKINIGEEIGIFQKKHFAQVQHSVLASSFTRGWNGKYFDPTAIRRTPGEENAGPVLSVVL